MPKKSRHEKARPPSPDSTRHPTRSAQPAARSARVLALASLFVALAVGAFLWGRANWGHHQSELKDPQPAIAPPYVPHPPGRLTFTKDIAPIVFQHCATCHRPGQSAPFSLLSFQDIKKHAADIVDVTARRYMPPWLPEHGYGDFVGERRLTVDQIGSLKQWVAEGQPEGSAADLPPLPTWTGDWQLGKPDLVVKMPQPYTLAAEGRDVNRNFVVPVPLQEKHFVKGVEFHPGNPRIVHHAFVKIDSSGLARTLDEEDAEIGFPGLNPPGSVPDCNFLGWQPGRMPEMGMPGLPWLIEPGNDLVLQMHLNTSGKPELLQSSVGFYFTDQGPTNACSKIALFSAALDIPPGDTNYVVEDSFLLPVDVQLLAVLPHAHYLGRDMRGWAIRPDGSRQWLLWIRNWDFNWQGDYRYANPVLLPKGSALCMRYTYDNSTNNVRNPSHPPKLVVYGEQSVDEMAELWWQLLPRNQEDRARLARAYEIKMARFLEESDLLALRRDPNNPGAHTDLGMALMEKGKAAEAEAHFQAALRAHPDFALAHYDYGLLLRRLGRLAEAQIQFLEDLRIHPNDYKAHGNLGFIYLDQGNFGAARAEFESALRVNPNDALAREGLEEASKH